jgi:hypothetical protein
MTPSESTQERILARLSAMEEYLAQIARAVTAIAARQPYEYDLHSAAGMSAPAEPQPTPGWLSDAGARPIRRQLKRGGLTQILGPREPPSRIAAVHGATGDATRIFAAPSPADAPPAAPPVEEQGEFDKYFGPRDVPMPNQVTAEVERDEFDAMFGPSVAPRGGE